MLNYEIDKKKIKFKKRPRKYKSQLMLIFETYDHGRMLLTNSINSKK